MIKHFDIAWIGDMEYSLGQGHGSTPGLQHDFQNKESQWFSTFHPLPPTRFNVPEATSNKNQDVKVALQSPEQAVVKERLEWMKECYGGGCIQA